MGTIDIIKLKTKAVIGIYKYERFIRQPVYFDVTIRYNSEAATVSDNIEYAVDYNTICKLIRKFVKNSSFYLIEKLCSEVVKLISDQPYVNYCKVTVYKPRAVWQSNISFSLEYSE